MVQKLPVILNQLSIPVGDERHSVTYLTCKDTLEINGKLYMTCKCIIYSIIIFIMYSIIILNDNKRSLF